MVTFDGFPLGYEVFAGNTHDSRTLQTIVTTMEARHGMVGRVWITDRGMASAANLAWLRQTGRRYIIGAPKSELKQVRRRARRPDGWRAIRDGIEVKLARRPETGETVILCRSADRRSKEQAMHDKFSRRIEAALARLAARIDALEASGSMPATVNRQIGRILQQNQRAAARFADHPAAGRLPGRLPPAASTTTPPSTTGPRSRKAPICCAPTSPTGAMSSCGRPTSSSPRPKPPSASRRISCNVRPIWHQRDDRVQAHILVCFLAFVLWKSLEMWQQRAGLGNSPRTVLEELARIQSHDVVLPTTTHGEIRLRCVTQPDAAQAAPARSPRHRPAQAHARAR